MTTIGKLIEAKNANGMRKLLATNPGAVNELDNDRSPLSRAILWSSNMEEVVRVIIAAGANVNFQNTSGECALHVAAWYNRKEIAEILIAAAANVNIQDKNMATPLFMAADHDAKKVASVLIAAGAIVDLQDQHGRTPLYLAALKGRLEMTNVLLAAGARPNWASMAITGDMEGAKALLMTNPNDVNKIYEEGSSPLHKATEYNSIDVAKVLIASGANIDLQDQRGWSPLYRAIGMYAEKVAEILVTAGANVNIQDEDGFSPLHNAASRGDEKTTVLLLAAGANTNIQDKNGKTPLMIAREKRESKVVTILESPENYIIAYREEQRRQKEAEDTKRQLKEAEDAKRQQKEAEEEQRRQKEAEELRRLERISLLLQQQKFFPGDRIAVVNSTSATAGSMSVGDVGEVLEYKINDFEASYVVRVVSGPQSDQVVSYSPTSLNSYSEVMCQRLGLDDILFQKCDRIIMTIRRQKYKELEIEKVAAIAARQMAKAKEISSHMKSIYIYDKTEAIPDSEKHTFVSSLLQDLEARYMQLAIEDKYEEAELCDSTKNELLQYYNEICQSSVSNHRGTLNDEKSESTELLTFLEDTCHIEDCMAKHYSAQLNTFYEIDSIKYLKLLLRISSLRNILAEFISSDEDITKIEIATRTLFPNIINTNNDSNTNIPMIGKSFNESYSPVVLSSSNCLSTMMFHIDGTAIHNIRPLSETLDMGSANRISYDNIYTGYFLQVIGVDVVIKVGDGRRDLTAEETILRYLRDRSKEAVGAIRLIDYSAASVPPYLVLEKYGEDIRSLFQSPAAARNCKKFIVYLLEAVDSIHKVGIMHGNLKPQNILFRNAVGNFGFKLCNFECACNIGEVRLVTKYTKAWVSPEVYFANENRREVKASSAIDVFSLGLILGALFDGNCYADKTILPVENPKDFHRALSDQEYLYTLLPCNDHTFDKTWIHSMCRLDSAQRSTVNSIIRNLETDSRTNLAMQDKYLKNNIDSNVDTIDDMILVSISSCFESLKSHLTDLILSSVEISLNNSNDDNNILEKLLIATNHYSGSLKSSSGSSDKILSEAKEGLKRMEDAIRVAMESHIAKYEVGKRQEMLELQTTILNRCQDLEAILKDRSADSKIIQATLNAFAQCSQLLHQELLKLHQELDSMKQNLFQLAVTTRNIVNNNEKLRLSMDSLDVGIHRIHKSKLEEYQTLIQSKERLQALIVSTPFIASSLQGAMTETNTRLLTLLKGIYDIPTLMVLLPELETGAKHIIKNTSIMFTDNYRLFFVCSHTLCIVPCGPKGQGYPLSVPKEWVKKAAPVFKIGLVALKLALTNSRHLFPYSDILKDLTIFEQQSNYFNAALRNLQNVSISAVTAMECQTAALSKEDCLSFLDHCNAEGIRAAYEAIKEILKDFPNFSRNCGLVFVEHQGNVSWVLRGQEENWRLAMRER